MRKLIPIFLLIILTACNPVRGFLEAEFILPPESPLPAWYPNLPEGYNRSEVTIRIKNYSPLFPVNNTVFIVQSSWWHTLYTATGHSEFHPKYLAWAEKDWPTRAVPNYSYLTIDGKTEILEQRERNNVLYISSEEAVKKLLGAEYQ
jgi:hypothetical protein